MQGIKAHAESTSTRRESTNICRKSRMREDSNPRSPQRDAGFQDRNLKPLRHSSQVFLRQTHGNLATFAIFF